MYIKPQNIVIIGNGTAGISAASKLRQLDKTLQISILTDENHLYYSRPRLLEFISNQIKLEDLIIHKKEWYEKNNIKLHLNTVVTEIDTNKKQVKTNNNKIKFDKLLLATGSSPNLIPIDGINNKNIFTLRTLDDAIKIKASSKDKKEVIIIGGGLLGLEIANSFTDETRTIKVIEISPYLLSRQLNEAQSNKLKSLLETNGFKFYLDEMCSNIKTIDNKLYITTKKNTKISGDIILMSAGIKANLQLPKSSVIETDKGIKVNNYLQTSQPDIYAAGDCIQLNDKLWGFIKSSAQQGQIAAKNMLNNNTTEYSGTIIDPILKVTNINLKEL
jgi:nitrite reductase (NADH) large subunit